MRHNTAKKTTERRKEMTALKKLAVSKRILSLLLTAAMLVSLGTTVIGAEDLIEPSMGDIELNAEQLEDQSQSPEPEIIIEPEPSTEPSPEGSTIISPELSSEPTGDVTTSPSQEVESTPDLTVQPDGQEEEQNVIQKIFNHVVDFVKSIFVGSAYETVDISSGVAQAENSLTVWFNEERTLGVTFDAAALSNMSGVSPLYLTMLPQGEGSYQLSLEDSIGSFPFNNGIDGKAEVIVPLSPIDGAIYNVVGEAGQSPSVSIDSTSLYFETNSFYSFSVTETIKSDKEDDIIVEEEEEEEIPNQDDITEEDPDTSADIVLEHEHEYIQTIITDATCTQVGQASYSCECGDSYTADLPTADHDYIDGVCTVCGHTEDGHSHKYSEAITSQATCTEAGLKTFTCSCGDSYTEEIPAAGHSYDSEGLCSACGGQHVHEYTETVTAQATCAVPGQLTLTCECGDVQTQELTASHSYSETNGVCSVCGAVELSATYDGISVTASDGAEITIYGYFPKLGAYITAEPVALQPEDIGQDSETTAIVAAYDIKIFRTADNAEYQPGAENPVSVKIYNPSIADASEVDIYHIDSETEEAEHIETVSTPGQVAKFDAESFSIYVVASNNSSSSYSSLPVGGVLSVFSTRTNTAGTWSITTGDAYIDLGASGVRQGVNQVGSGHENARSYTAIIGVAPGRATVTYRYGTGTNQVESFYVTVTAATDAVASVTAQSWCTNANLNTTRSITSTTFAAANSYMHSGVLHIDEYIDSLSNISGYSMFYKAKVFTTPKPTDDKWLDLTLDGFGVEINYLKYENGGIYYSADNTTWYPLMSTQSLVFYYLQDSNIYDINTKLVDISVSDGFLTYRPDQAWLCARYTLYDVDLTVLGDPVSTYYYNSDGGHPGIGAIYVNSTDYDIVRITYQIGTTGELVTITGDALNSPFSIPWNGRTDDSTITDIKIYIAAKTTEDNLTVNYYVDGAESPFYSRGYVVNEGTNFVGYVSNERKLLIFTVTNNNGTSIPIQTDLNDVAANIGANINPDLYEPEYTHATVTDNNKVLNIYYKAKPGLELTKVVVADTGVSTPTEYVFYLYKGEYPKGDKIATITIDTTKSYTAQMLLDSNTTYTIIEDTQAANVSGVNLSTVFGASSPNEDGSYTFTTGAAGTGLVAVTCTNTYTFADVQLKIVKTDGTNEIKGAKFKLDGSLSNGTTVTDTIDLTNATNTTLTLAPGSYTLEETEAPTGHTGISGKVSFTVANGAVTLGANVPDGVTLDNTATPPTLTVVNTPYAKLTINKYNDSDEILTGVTFTLEKQGSTADSWESVTLPEALNTTGSATVSLESGYYKLTETGTPKEYMGLSEPIYFTVSGSTITYTGTNDSVSFYDPNASTPVGEGNYAFSIFNTAKAALIVKKFDDSGTELLGARFRVDMLVNGSYTYNQSIDLTGNSSTTYIYLMPGTYRIAETTTPEGYVGMSGTDLVNLKYIQFKVEGTTISIDTENSTVTGDFYKFASDISCFTLDIINFAKVNMVIKKTDGSSALPGAEFSLEKKDAEGNYAASGINISALSGNNATANITLEPGDYRISETKAPAGYNPMSGYVYFTVAKGAVTVAESTTAPTGSYSFTAATTDPAAPATLTIINTAGARLPDTGGIGTTGFTIIGIVVMLAALAALVAYVTISKKRKNQQGK